MGESPTKVVVPRLTAYNRETEFFSPRMVGIRPQAQVVDMSLDNGVDPFTRPPENFCCEWYFYICFTIKCIICSQIVCCTYRWLSSTMKIQTNNRPYDYLQEVYLSSKLPRPRRDSASTIKRLSQPFGKFSKECIQFNSIWHNIFIGVTSIAH